MTGGKLRRKILLGIGGIVIALLVGEVVARIALPLLPDPSGTAYVRDPDCGYRLRPSQPGEYPEQHDSHINSFGFRDRNHSATGSQESYRVLGIGDSFVYGAVATDRVFLRIAQNRLRRLRPALGWNKQVDVLHLGVPGYSPENEANLLESFGLGLEPDLVVVNFFVGNDVTGIPVRGKVIRGRMYYTHSPIRLLNLARKSQLFQLCEAAFYRELKRKLADAPATATSPRTTSEDIVPVNDLYLKIMENNLPVYRKGTDLDGLWTESLGHLERIDTLCRQAGVPWLLVLIPGEVQVDPVVRFQVLAGLEHNPDVFDFDAPQRRLSAWAAAQDVRILDLLPRFRKAHQPQNRLYLPNDTHWNEAGNELAGELLAATIARHIQAELGQ